MARPHAPPVLSILLLSLLLTLLPVRALAQEPDEAAEALPQAEAQALLLRALPSEPAARLALLDAQMRAAQALGQRALQIALTRRLVDEGRALAEPAAWGEWLRFYLSSEFTFGQATRALDACEPYLADATLPLGLRAGVALRQTYMAAQEGELERTLNHWRRAQGLLAEQRAAGAASTTAEALLGVEALQVRAEVERLQGRHDAAVASLREAIREAQALQADVLHERNGLARHPDVQRVGAWVDGSRGMLVYALVRQGRAGEALQLADEQLRRARRGDLPAASATRWLYRQAHALNALQRHAEALAAAESALAQMQAAQVQAASHVGHLALAERLRALMGLRRWAEADAAYQAHLAAVEGDRIATARARSPALAALLAAQAGRFEEALAAAERSLRYRERLFGSDHPASQEMAGVRGFVRLARGDAAGAEADFERLFSAVLDRSGGWLDLDQRGARGFVLGLVFDAYLRDLIGRAPAELGPARIERALQIADRLKLGATQRALLDASSRLQARSPALREALEAEQVARQAQEARVETLQGLFAEEDAARRRMASEAFKALGKEARQRERDALAALRERIGGEQQALQAARAALLAQRERLQREHPGHADLVSPTLPGTAQLAALLRPGEALLVVHALESGTLSWLLRPGEAARLRALAPSEAQLDALVAAWRARLDRSDRLGEAVDPLDGASQALQLHEAVLMPWRAELAGVRSLLVASSGALARVPLAALLREAPQPGRPLAWLVRDMAVTQLPAAASLLALRRAPPAPPPPRALLGFGDPLFDSAQASEPPAARGAPRRLAPPPGGRALRWDEQRGLRYGEIPALPDTRVELLAIARALKADPRADLRLGRAATRRAVLETDLSDRRVLAFATHGLLPGELPGLSKPALALAPEGEGSPLLELDDVLLLRLRAQWVLLSACNTAAAQADPAGRAAEQAMSGLVRGFFFAGARSVLATHWAVESESAAALSGAVFAQPAASRAEQLRRAQLRLADGAPKWRHPYFWAGYALFGDPEL